MYQIHSTIKNKSICRHKIPKICLAYRLEPKNWIPWKVNFTLKPLQWLTEVKGLKQHACGRGLDSNHLFCGVSTCKSSYTYSRDLLCFLSKAVTHSYWTGHVRLIGANAACHRGLRYNPSCHGFSGALYRIHPYKFMPWRFNQSYAFRRDGANSANYRRHSAERYYKYMYIDTLLLLWQ